jgi:methionyl-tRNA formyltransferase
MFDTIILLTGHDEYSVFAPRLRECNASLNILPAFNADDLRAITPEQLQRARLIAFTTDVIVHATVLDQLGYGAYNFHPGPPQYPGWAPAHFATYDRATDFGCTLHHMVERVDAGPIVAVDMFAIPQGLRVGGLEHLVYTRLIEMFFNMSPTLAKQMSPLTESDIRWGNNRKTRADFAAICEIPLTISLEELQHRVAVFGDSVGVLPTLELHGYKFTLVAPETGSAPVASQIEANVRVAA